MTLQSRQGKRKLQRTGAPPAAEALGRPVAGNPTARKGENFSKDFSNLVVIASNVQGPNHHLVSLPRFV